VFSKRLQTSDLRLQVHHHRRPVRVLLLFGLWTGLEEAVLNGEGYGRVVERDG